MPSVPCPQCGVTLNVPESAFGQTRPCPHCKQRVRLQRPKPVDAITGLNFEDKDLFDEDDSAADLDTTPGKKRKSPAGGSSGPVKKTTKKPTKPKKKPASDDTEIPPWVIPAAIGGVVALFFIVILIVMIGGGSGTTAPPIALSREPQRGPNSFVPYAPPTGADTKLWKVTVDTAPPPPAGLQSFFGAPNRDAVVAFASPAAATAAVLDRRGDGTQWLQYSLDKSEQLGKVDIPGSFGGDRQAPVVALSPLGKQLALRGSGEGGEKRVVLFKTDGTEAASIDVDAPMEGISWLSFPSEERLLVLAGDRLRGFDVPSGREAFLIEGVKALPSTSPGGKWVAALIGEGIGWYSTADGTVAGVSPLPEAWFTQDQQVSPQPDLAGKRLARVAFSRAGRSAAIVVVNPHSDVHIAEVDLSTGQIRDAFVLQHRQTQEVQKLLDAAWVGERQLLFPSGMLVDLDLKTWLVRYEPGTWCGAGPDGRYWRVLAGRELGQSDKLSGHQAVLAAVTLPDPVAAEQLRDARGGGFAWHPGQAVRIEVAGNLPDREREATIEAFAAMLVQRGMQIRPDAQLGARLNIGVRPGLVTGKSRPALDTTDRAEEYKEGKAGTLRISIVDEHGNPMLVVSAPDEKPDAVTSTYGGSSAEQLWRQLRAKIDTLRLPRLYFRTDGGRRLSLSQLEIRRAQAGIDGLAKPTYPNLDGIPDAFALPSDR